MKMVKWFVCCVSVLLLVGILPMDVRAEEPRFLTDAYVIVYPDLADRKETSTAKSLQKALRAAGLDLEIKTDWLKNGEPLPSTGYELLIGETNRPESAAALLDLRKDDFIIRRVGDRIVILGGTPTATVQAVNYFKERYILENRCILPDEPYVFHGTYLSRTLLLNGVDITDYTIVTVGLKAIDHNRVDDLVDLIEDVCGYSLPVADEAKSPTISIIRTDEDVCAIEVTENSIVIRGGGENGLAFALLDFMKSIQAGITPPTTSIVVASQTINTEGRSTAELPPAIEYLPVPVITNTAGGNTMKDTIKVNLPDVHMVAHRGLCTLERENTAAAFIAAGNRSYWGIECDLWHTADGYFIVSHDGNTEYVTGVSYDIETTDLATLRSLTITDLSGQPRADLRFPTLEEYVRICKQYDKYCVLELKPGFSSDELDRIIDIIRDLGWLDHTVFISFNYENCIRVRQKLPNQPVQLLKGSFTDDANLLNFLIQYRLDLDILYSEVTKEQIALCHANGIKVNVWTLDNSDIAREMADWGVDFITTNILE